jgi:putative DNA primase/helicase
VSTVLTPTRDELVDVLEHFGYDCGPSDGDSWACVCPGHCPPGVQAPRSLTIRSDGSIECTAGCSLDDVLSELHRDGAWRGSVPNGNGATDSATADTGPTRHANGAGPRLSPPTDPMAVARELLAARYTHPSGALLLRHWRAGWWEWQTRHWAEVEERAVRAAAYAFTEHATYIDGDEPKPWRPNKRKIADLLEATAAIAHLPDSVIQPAWIGDAVRMVRGPGDCGPYPLGPIVSCANGLLDLTSRTLFDHHPRFFNQTSVPFDFDRSSPLCTRWLQFLNDLWPTTDGTADHADQEAIAALQEWFGYTVSGRTDLQKILLIVGPTRGGKGAISRVLGALIGSENVTGPTPSSFRADFGLAPLIGKPLAVISDARLGGHDSTIVVERLLSVSGEDWITVNRKYREQWSGKLPTRFVICSNELPRLGDASGAIAGRFLTLLLNRSWLGNEDPDLKPALHRELPGILNWALDGLARLEEQGRFTTPRSSDAAFAALQDLASPVRAFIRDCCVTGADPEVSVDDLWKAWRGWAEDNGHGRGGTKQVFGRDLRAALPAVRVRRPRSGEHDRERVYVGLGLASSEPVGGDMPGHADEGELW